jgi:hypothetical protein
MTTPNQPPAPGISAGSGSSTAPMPGAIPAAPSKIRHTLAGISNDPAPVPVVPATGPVAANKITAFGKERRHEEEWARVPNTTGTGAIHVRTFHAKLTDDALTFMDRAINEWLDAHPQYEVKFVTSTVGVLTGKMKEPHLICQVWV